MHTSATILLVEDDESLQEGIHDLLEIADCGYEIQVLTAADGQAGLEIMRTVTPDLIISDIMMPQMDGLEFLQVVRATTQWAHVPFIFLTAKGKKQDIRRGRLSGAELYITKPFNSNELIELVATQLNRSFERQAAQQSHLHSFKRSMLQLLNHEFRTPLTYVTAYYEMLTDSLVVYEDMENLDAYLKGILSGCVRLSRLIEALILVMEIRTGEVAAQFAAEARPVENLADIARRVVEQRTAASPSITFRCTGLENMPPVWGVPDQLRLVLEQLVDNAIKFLAYKFDSPKEVTLSAEIDETNGRLQIHVTDNGIGIPETAQNQIFDLFYQYNREHLEQQGSGAGLAIAKGLANVHGGHISVRSTEGQGSQFTLHLPIYTGATGTAASTPALLKAKAHVLVVEDDQYLLDGLQALLEFYDGPYELQVSTAVNGLAGVQAVMRQPPNLIISDIMMPKMDGFEFLSEVRSHPDWLQIPFIFLTAKGEATDVHKGRQSGVEEYITKPYDSDELLELVTIQLNRYFELLGLAQQGFEDLKQSILQLLQTDFRTPLNSVADYSHSLASELQQAQTAADLKKSLQGIQMGSQQLSGLVENFILLAELKTGEAQNAFEVRAAMHTNLLDVLEQAVELVEADGWPNGVHLAWEKLKLHQAILLDQEVALYALRRLVEVGCQTCLAHNGRTLTLAVRENGREVQLEMRRDGRPFAPDLFEYIQRLFLTNEEQIIDHATYGSALCIVHGVMQLHGGRVELDNTADQVSITLHWPIYQATDTRLFD